MKQSQDFLTISTRRPGHHNITREITAWLAGQAIRSGLLTVLIQHVRASLTIRESIDRDDLHTFFDTLEGAYLEQFEAAPRYAAQLSIPVRDGQLLLGARQGLYLNEERDTPHQRSLVLHLLGE